MPDNLYRRGRAWYYRVQVEGQELRGSLHTGVLAEARKRLRKKLDELSHQRFYGEERHTWHAAVGKWLQEVAPGLKPAERPTRRSRRRTA